MLFFPKKLIKTTFIEQRTDTSTSSTSFVDLLTLSYVYSTGTRIFFDFSACLKTGSATDGAKFRIIDSLNTFVVGCTAAVGRNGASSPGICAAMSGFLPYSHLISDTIKIQWCSASGGTASILPVTGNGHACLFLAEISLD